MAFKIVWTKRADKKLWKIIRYLEKEWGANTARDFDRRVFDFLEILSKFPELGSIEEKEKGIRGFVLTKYTKLFYRVKGKEIILLTLFDTRMNPQKKFH